MGTYLRTLKEFQVQAEVTQEYVLTDGQKLQFGNITTLLARMPYKMRVSVEGELKSRCSFTTENHSLFSRAARGTTQPCRRLKQSAS